MSAKKKKEPVLNKNGKKRVNGRAKGAVYERYTAKILTEWSGIALFRSPMSGGWGSKSKGDITPKDPDQMLEWFLSVECKKHEKWCFEDLVKNTNKDKMLDWWAQCKRDAEAGKKIPMLIFSKNGDADYVWVRGEDFKKFKHLGKFPNLIKFRSYAIFLLDHLVKVDFKKFKRCLNE